MTEPAARDYDHRAAEHREWTDLQHFTEGLATHPRGLHSIGLGAGEVLDVLVAGSPGSDGRAVPVFLGGSVPSRGTRSGPFFSGGRLGPHIASGYVDISDPTVDRDPEVPLAWYAGNEFADVPAAVLGVLDALGAAWNTELVLVGGSGGGFASLVYAGRTTATASAFVWNPQTDILAYNRKFVDAYLRSAHPSTFDTAVADDRWRTEYAAECARAGVQPSVLDGTHAPSSVHRLLVLQNLGDWHLTAHTAPYIERHGFRSMGTGSYLLDPEHVVQVADWGPGHDPLPEPTAVEHLRVFLDGSSTALDLGRALATGPRCRSGTLEKAPMDLRPVRDVLERSIAVSPIGPDGRFRVSTGDVPIGYGGLRFGVARQEGTGNRQLAWFQEGPHLAVAPQEVDPAARITLTVRDGFNHHLASIPLDTAPGDAGAAPPPVPDPRRTAGPRRP